jgi:hypothetical protein
MKKYLLAAILAISASAAFAQTYSVGVEGERFSSHNGVSVNSFAVTPRVIVDGITFDAKLATARADVLGGARGTNIEAGVTSPSLVVGYVAARQVTVNARIAIGQLRVLGTSNTYYMITPAVSYAVDPKVLLTASYRFENTFHSPLAGSSNQFGLTAAYKLTPADTVSVKGYHETGYDHGNGAILALNHTF